MSWLDSLYFQGKLLNILTKKEDFDAFLKEKNFSEKYLRGYLYLIEVTINALINCIEFLIKDENIYGLIHYQNIRINDISKKYRDSSDELRFILRLEKIRREIAGIRKNGDNNINEKINILTKTVDEILKYFLSTKRAKINNQNKEKENLYFIVELTNKQNYIEADFDLFEEGKEPIPTYPACNYYNLRYQEIYSEYHLQNQPIKDFDEEYVNGYSLGLALLYNSLGFVPENLIDELCKCKDWIELHKIGSKIYDATIRNKKIDLIGKPIYEEVTTSENTKLQKSEIDKKDLRFLFRDRKMFIIEPKERGYPTELVPFFISLISGRRNFDDKPDIIELKVKKTDGFWYSYAVFVPHGGALWNASYWVLFKDIAFERGENYKTDGKVLIEGYLKEEDFIIHQHEVSQKILDNYFAESESNYQIKRKLKLMLKDSNSLLVELLALYHIAKQTQEKIIDLDWGINIKNGSNSTTEADLIIYFDKKVMIVQSQTNLYKSTEGLVEHFKQVEEFLKNNKNDEIKNKGIEKVVFTYFNDSYSDGKEIQKLKKQEIQIIFFEGLLNSNPNLLEADVKKKLFSCLQERFK